MISKFSSGRLFFPRKVEGSSGEIVPCGYFASFPESLRARAYGLGRASRPASTLTESAENRCAQRRHGLERHPQILASTSHGRRRSGVDLFGRASRGLYCVRPFRKVHHYLVKVQQNCTAIVTLTKKKILTGKIYIISQKAKFNPRCLNHAVLLVSSRIADCNGASAGA